MYALGGGNSKCKGPEAGRSGLSGQVEVVGVETRPVKAWSWQGLLQGLGVPLEDFVLRPGV